MNIVSNVRFLSRQMLLNPTHWASNVSGEAVIVLMQFALPSPFPLSLTVVPRAAQRPLRARPEPFQDIL